MLTHVHYAALQHAYVCILSAATHTHPFICCSFSQYLSFFCLSFLHHVSMHSPFCHTIDFIPTLTHSQHVRSLPYIYVTYPCFCLIPQIIILLYFTHPLLSLYLKPAFLHSHCTIPIFSLPPCLYYLLPALYTFKPP